MNRAKTRAEIDREIEALRKTDAGESVLPGSVHQG